MKAVVLIIIINRIPFGKSFLQGICFALSRIARQPSDCCNRLNLKEYSMRHLGAAQHVRDGGRGFSRARHVASGGTGNRRGFPGLFAACPRLRALKLGAYPSVKGVAGSIARAVRR
jgi:hypothetical protein